MSRWLLPSEPHCTAQIRDSHRVPTADYVLSAANMLMFIIAAPKTSAVYRPSD